MPIYKSPTTIYITRYNILSKSYIPSSNWIAEQRFYPMRYTKWLALLPTPGKYTHMYIGDIKSKVLIKYIIKNVEVHNLNKVYTPIKT